ncbi:MAG: hypothetical protein AAGC44_00745 [Planctomycetota bacterium]
MDEQDYWDSLEFRISREFAGTEKGKQESIWCDGLIPEHYLLGQLEPKITGVAWICHGPNQGAWQFVLYLIGEPKLASDIEWESQLPSDEVTEWLSYEPDERRIVIRLQSAAGT